MRFKKALLLGLMGGQLPPSLDLNFLSESVDPRITFSGGANATRINSAGLIVAATTPRFDFNPVTLAARGLLVEEARTNLLWPSIPDAAGTSFWTNGSAITSVTNNAAVAPDGATTATAFVGLQGNSNAAGGSSLRAIMGVVAAGSYTFSFYARGAAGGMSTTMRFVDNGSGLDTSILCTAADGGANALTTGWRRYYATVPQPAGSTSFAAILAFGANTDTIYIWGAQFELGAFPTSYIPTTTATVTRTADSATMTGTNFSSWYNQTEGTFVAAALYGADLVSNYILSASNGGTGELVEIVAANSGSSAGPYGQIRGGGVDQAAMTDGAPLANTRYVSALAYQANNFGFSRDGRTPVVDVSGTIPTVSQLSIGARASGGTTFFNGWIQSIQYYPRRPSNPVLQKLTAS